MKNTIGLSYGACMGMLVHGVPLIRELVFTKGRRVSSRHLMEGGGWPGPG